MKHVSSKSMKLSTRIGLAVATALLATQVSTGRASASVQGLTITSITRLNLTTIQVSGTATFEEGDQGTEVHGDLAQIQRGVGRVGFGDDAIGNVPGDASANPRGTSTYDWTISFYNPYGWKTGPATLTVTAGSYDPILGEWTRQSKSGKVILPK
jgi:hypothetical protein